MKHYCIYSIIFFLFTSKISAQKETGSGHYLPAPTPCITPEYSQQIIKQIQKNRVSLLANGKLKAPKKMRIAFDWPLKMANGVDYCNYYAISSFVDHNPNYPNQLQDYHCGTRTYDLASGYNHQGVDIFLWPFPWKMKNNSEVEVIAAADGVIVEKLDGNIDNNCDMNNTNWNAIFIQHADGTVAWYGHMKKNSLTNKQIGDAVVTGEKLGIVASSGASTAPHLHFEIHDALNNVVDPFNGTCSSNPSMWLNQEDYYVPSINAAFTHSAAPVYNTCPQEETTNLKDTFYAGDPIVFAAYFRDMKENTGADYIVRQADNSVFDLWSNNANAYYAASYYWWSNIIPNNPKYGKWTFSVNYNGYSCSHDFWVLESNNPTSTNNMNSQTQKIKIYPNPANEIVHIENNTQEPIQLTNLFGQTIQKWENQTQISTKELPNGLYFLKIGNTIQKLIIQHE